MKINVHFTAVDSAWVPHFREGEAERFLKDYEAFLSDTGKPGGMYTLIAGRVFVNFTHVSYVNVMG